MMMSGTDPALIEIGVVGAPFGVRGWVKLRSFTDPPEALLAHEPLRLALAGGWRGMRIEEHGRSGGQLTVKFAGVADRTAAEALRGARIAVARVQLPAAGQREYYRADLIGFDVVTTAGTPLGKVRHFVETPAHALMVVGEAARPGHEYWVPAVPRHLRRVELEARRVVVDWDEAEAAE